MGLRPRLAHRHARQGARRGEGARLDGRRHEERLEEGLPVPVNPGPRDKPSFGHKWIAVAVIVLAAAAGIYFAIVSRQERHRQTRRWPRAWRRQPQSLRPRSQCHRALPARRRTAWSGSRAASSRWARRIRRPGREGRHAGHHDSRPIHRVYVDGFWMDATEVTNAQFAEFVKATGYVTVAERTPTRGGISGRAAGEPRRRFGRLLAARPGRAARQPLPLVGVREGRRLAAPVGPAERSKGREQYPGRARRLGRCGRLREVGRQAAADRGGVGVRRARRPRRDRSIPGATSSWPDGQWMANTTRATSPIEDTAADGFPASPRSRSSRRTATGSTTWAATSGSG